MLCHVSYRASNKGVLTEGLEVFDGHKLEFCGVPLGRVVVYLLKEGGRCVLLSESVYAVVFVEWSCSCECFGG